MIEWVGDGVGPKWLGVETGGGRIGRVEKGAEWMCDGVGGGGAA